MCDVMASAPFDFSRLGDARIFIDPAAYANPDL